MRLRTTAAHVLGVIALAACSTDQPAPTSPATASLAVGSGKSFSRHMVLFTGDKAPADFATAVARLGGTVESVRDGIGFATVTGLSASAAAQLSKAGGVASVDQDVAIRLERPAAQLPGIDFAVGSDAVAPTSQADPASAARFARQWNMRAIHAPEAWAAGALGSPAVKIGILDTGLDDRHVDIAGRVDGARSASMLTKHPQYDDDGNVITDDDGNPILVADNDSVAKYWPGAGAWVDLHYHGTHVGTTVSSNAIRAAGVTSKTTLVAVKVCSYIDAAGCPTSAVLQGIAYAADAGVDVINMSLGGSFNRRDASARGGNGPSFIAYINRFFNYASKKGVTIVVSAGNAAADLDHDKNGYKAYCSNPNVICVSATGPLEGDFAGPNAFIGGFSDLDAPSVYTNFGRSAINVAAPGGNYTVALVGGVPTAVSGGFVWAACSTRSLAQPGCQTGNQFILGLAGTSMASPHVAGLAALLVERYGRSPSQIRAAIQQSADDLGQSGTDPFYGKGRINVARAVGAN
jgi:lantibiotic leader peptide-processing serine protease